jgi:hypothetical protein
MSFGRRIGYASAMARVLFDLNGTLLEPGAGLPATFMELTI